MQDSCNPVTVKKSGFVVVDLDCPFLGSCSDGKIVDHHCSTVWGMNSKVTQLKFRCKRVSHYASDYHYDSQSIAFSGQ